MFSELKYKFWFDFSDLPKPNLSRAGPYNGYDIANLGYD